MKELSDWKSRGYILALLILASQARSYSVEIIHTTANLSEARWRLASTTVGNKAIFAGGQTMTGTHYSNAVDIYDYGTGQWTTANLSQARCDLVGVTAGTKALFAGGYYTGYKWSNVIDIYDLETETWSKTYLPRPGHGMTAVALGSKVLFAGGTGQGAFVDIYDIETNTWARNNISAQRYNMASTTAGNKALLAGGNRGGTNFSNVDIYDLETDTWTLAHMSQAKLFVAGATVGSKALFAGGCTTGPVSTVDIYDDSTGTWSVDTMPGPLGEPVGTSVGNYAFFAGCWSSDSVHIYDDSTGLWDSLFLTGGERYSLTATSVGNQAMFAGGGDYGNYSSIVDIYTVIFEPVEVAVDIKPTNCPNPLNVKSKGVLPVAILGSGDFDVTTIDPASIVLEGVPAIRSNFEDVATPVTDGNECECTEEGPDGYLDLTLKFETQAIVEAIGNVNDGDVLPLTLEGVLLEEFTETPIRGEDCIVVRGKFKSLHGADINKDGLVNWLDFAVFADNWQQLSIVEDQPADVRKV